MFCDRKKKMKYYAYNTLHTQIRTAHVYDGSVYSQMVSLGAMFYFIYFLLWLLFSNGFVLCDRTAEEEKKHQENSALPLYG